MSHPSVTVWVTVSAALAAVAVGSGAALAASGVFVAEPTPATIVFATTVDGLDCPGGTPVVAFGQDSRVLAIARSEDGAFLGVRNPLDLRTTVWIPAEAADADAGQPALDTLEVSGCDVPIVTTTADAALPPPVEVPVSVPVPGQPAPPAAPTPPAPPANTPPSLGQVSASSTQLGCTAGYQGRTETTTISVQASDNAGVTGVTATLSGADTGSRALTGSGNTWSLVYNPADSPGIDGNVTFTLVATDGSLTSNSAAVVVNVTCFG